MTTEYEKKLIKIIAIFVISMVSITFFVYYLVVSHRFDNPESEVHFTQEQRAVLSALHNARDEVERVQADLEKNKKEVIQLINDIKATVIAKNLDSNVLTTYVAHGVKGTYASKAGHDEVPVLLGFRNDRLVVWKFADEP